MIDCAGGMHAVSRGECCVRHVCVALPAFKNALRFREPCERCPKVSPSPSAMFASYRRSAAAFLGQLAARPRLRAQPVVAAAPDRRALTSVPPAALFSSFPSPCVKSSLVLCPQIRAASNGNVATLNPKPVSFLFC